MIIAQPGLAGAEGEQEVRPARLEARVRDVAQQVRDPRRRRIEPRERRQRRREERGIPGRCLGRRRRARARVPVAQRVAVVVVREMDRAVCWAYPELYGVALEKC